MQGGNRVARLQQGVEYGLRVWAFAEVEGGVPPGSAPVPEHEWTRGRVRVQTSGHDVWALAADLPPPFDPAHVAAHAAAAQTGDRGAGVQAGAKRRKG